MALNVSTKHFRFIWSAAEHHISVVFKKQRVQETQSSSGLYEKDLIVPNLLFHIFYTPLIKPTYPMITQENKEQLYAPTNASRSPHMLKKKTC
jgi:hypothetical protein